MSILVKIENTSDSFALGTETVKRRNECPHCGHQPEPSTEPSTIIHPRDSDQRVIKCGDKLILTASFNDGIPPATY
jgi:hypothetical protein